MIELVKELGQIKQKIRRLEARLKYNTKTLFELKTRRDELETKLSDKQLNLMNYGETLTKSIMLTIVMSKKEMTPLEVLAILEGNGNVLKGKKDPYNVVFSICSRLAKRGDIHSAKLNGKRVFSKK